jgi:hypothetical protein
LIAMLSASGMINSRIGTMSSSLMDIGKIMKGKMTGRRSRRSWTMDERSVVSTSDSGKVIMIGTGGSRRRGRRRGGRRRRRRMRRRGRGRGRRRRGRRRRRRRRGRRRRRKGRPNRIIVSISDSGKAIMTGTGGGRRRRSTANIIKPVKITGPFFPANPTYQQFQLS